MNQRFAMLPKPLVLRLLAMQLVIRAHGAIQRMFPNADEAFFECVRIGWDDRQNCPVVTLA